MDEQNPWYIFDVYTSKGGKITCKLIDPRTFESDFAALMAATQNIVNKFGVTLTPPPLPDAPVAQIALPTKQQIQLHTEDGLPVVNSDGEPEMIELPEGTRVYSVKALWHDKTKTGKDVLKVTTHEDPYNTKYGVTAFHGGPENWKTWPEGIDHQFKAPKTFAHVIIKDPEGEGKYPEVIRFEE